jgi:hypothetical protein
MNHQFNVEIAKAVGVNAAIIFENLQHWCEKNAANGKHFYDGNYWTYNSVNAFGLLFPYMTGKQIRSAIDRLIAEDMIVKGNFNVSAYDRTCWYMVKSTCPKSHFDLPSRANQNAPQGEPIPDINTDINTDNKGGNFFLQNQEEEGPTGPPAEERLKPTGDAPLPLLGQLRMLLESEGYVWDSDVDTPAARKLISKLMAGDLQRSEELALSKFKTLLKNLSPWVRENKFSVTYFNRAYNELQRPGKAAVKETFGAFE